MTGAYLYQGKARVRRVRFPLTGEWSWLASKPGNYYLVGDGLHFYTWRDAIDYVLDLQPSTPWSVFPDTMIARTPPQSSERLI